MTYCAQLVDIVASSSSEAYEMMNQLSFARMNI